MSFQLKYWYEKNWRWFVLATLFLATFLNYLDRQTLGAAMSPISQEFGLNNVQVGEILSAFLLTYAIAHLFIGPILDQIKNIRWFFPVMVIGWSLTTIVNGIVNDVNQLIGLRYFLGIWESINFPICILIISRIFPAKERTLASGIFASGAFFATLIAPKMVIYFSTAFTWRYAFYFSGGLGVLWLIPWFLVFRKPEKRSELWIESIGTAKGTINWQKTSAILSSPAFWGVTLIGIGIIPSLYFVTQWLPYYLEQSLGVAYDQGLGNKLLIIYLMQDLGLWLGGLLVLYWVNQKMSIINARRLMMIMSTIFMISIVVMSINQSMSILLIVLCLFTFGIGAFLANQHAFKQDIISGNVATVASWVGFIEMMFTHFVIKRIGLVTNETADFTPVFLFLAGLAVFALISAMILLNSKWLRIQ